MGVIYKSRIPAVVEMAHVRAQVAVATTAELVRQKMDSKVPVGAPDIHVKDTIRVIDGPTPFRKYVGAGDDETFYVHMVEFGTEHSAAVPFIIPSAEEARGAFVASMKQIV